MQSWEAAKYEKFNAFPNAHQLSFAAGLNVFVGENGRIKTQRNHPFSQVLNYNFKIQPY